MKTKKIISIYVSGFLVGIALVLFPAAGNLFVDPQYHGFSSAQYGSIFIPQIVFAIVSSLSAPKIAQKKGMKTVMRYGQFSILLSMLLLMASNWLMEGNVDYWAILFATGFLGIGFGFTITALNPFAYNLFPGKETSAVTAMHIMLGLGTASAALFLNAFLEAGFWWGAPLVVAAVVFIIWIFTLPLTLSLPDADDKQENKTKRKIPGRIILYILVVFLYGTCEATFGNFGAVFLEKEGGLSTAKAALGLSLFWGASP
ncbi:sugar MFS transporter [Flagellimonas sp. CMM7]|uniref:MFS transporter n=1 Tax=Flagellimonas sp. CMM7 TaxID=2654676 RepID=UPI001F166A40|nr:MFS transporter [Flagellimonas sp. CMM7]UII80317.1 MFS transporter [Flagellimonas sp. CMM7]